MACQVAKIIVRLGASDKNRVVQVKGFSWGQEWKYVLHDGFVSYMVPQNMEIVIRVLASHDERFGLPFGVWDATCAAAGHAAPSSCYIEQS